MKYLLYAFAAICLCFSGWMAGAAGQQPLYVYLFAKATDHVNLDMTENRLRYILPAVERYRKAHPEAQVSATVLFSGSVSGALQQRNGQTHIVDFVRDYIGRGVIEAGYDGTDEPTYENRPLLTFTMREAPQDRWKLRQATAEQFLTQARDPLTGSPLSGSGGLREMQEVFGKAAYIKGVELSLKTYRPAPRVRQAVPGTSPPGTRPFGPVEGIFKENGGDTETLQTMARYNTTAIMFGVPATNPAVLPGFTTAITRFGQQMSPVPQTAPEVYWQDNALRLSEAAPPVHLIRGIEGVDVLKGILDKTNRSTIQVLQVELGAVENYLQPDFAKQGPAALLQYAYAHPQAPAAPAAALRSTADVSAGWAKEDALLKWLTEDFFPANPGSRFLSTARLVKMAGASTGFTVSTDRLRTELADALSKLGVNNYLFNYLSVDGHFLSLAELFQVLTDELAEYRSTGKLPQSVKVVKMYGPFRLVTGHGPNVGDVTAGDLESFCAGIAASLHDDTSPDVPKNSVPPLVKLGGMDLNPAQLIRLMALALDNPAPETVLRVRMAYMLTEAGILLPKTRPPFDSGFLWTLKPAPLAIQ
jgi:hypothetical protein